MTATSCFRLLTRCFLAFKKLGLCLPRFYSQSKERTLVFILSGKFVNPTNAPTSPPTMHAFVSVSPPSYILHLIAHSNTCYSEGLSDCFCENRHRKKNERANACLMKPIWERGLIWDWDRRGFELMEREEVDASDWHSRRQADQTLDWRWFEV